MGKKELTEKSTIKQIGDIVSSNIDKEIVMMSIENEKYYNLDIIGSHIWELIKTPIKVSDLIDLLLEKYDVDRETCLSDVLEFLNELNNDKILEVQ